MLDPVEFEMTYDRKTGKPVASAVVKISPSVLTCEVMSKERVSGIVTTEIKVDDKVSVASYISFVISSTTLIALCF